MRTLFSEDGRSSCPWILLALALTPLPLGSAQAQSLLLNSPEYPVLSTPVVLLLVALAGAAFWIFKAHRKIKRLELDGQAAARSMRAVVESERRYRFIVDHAADVIWQLDRELRFTYVSDAIWNLAGYAPKEMVGTALAEIITGGSYHDLVEHLAKVDQHPVPLHADPFRIELELLKRDRTALWVEVHVTALRAMQGGVVGYFGVVRDVSERRRTETALRNSEIRARTLLEGTPFAVAVLRWQDGLVLYANDRAAAGLGTTVDQLIGRSILDFAASDETFSEMDREITETGAANDLQIMLKRADGRAFWAHSSARSVPFEQTSAVFLAFSDISGTKKVEADLLAANELLKQKLSEIEALQSQLREQAVRDGLTNLFNRRYFDETLERELARAKREKNPLALVMIDVDHFKRINDTYGHPTGDEVLKTLGKLLTQNTRLEDIVCRYGGEEFIVMMPKATAEIAAARAESWREAFAASAVQIGRKKIRATISLGVAAFPESASETEDLLQLVDAALYRAKREGRNRVALHEATAAVHRLELPLRVVEG